MDNPASTPPQNDGSNQPQAEVLKPRTDDLAKQTVTPPTPPSADGGKRHRTYRPSHRATFIGLGVVVAILAINAVAFTLVLKKQAKQDQLAKGSVTISSADLNKLGINRTTLGSAGVQLIVAPDAQFKGKLSVDGNTTLSGQLVLNSKLTGTQANLAQLQAGDTSLSKLNVNGDATVSTLNLRKDLAVVGKTQLQGPVTIYNLLTVANNINVAGNLSIGGTFSARSLTATSTLTVGGHIVTSGPSPSVSRGSATGSNGTVSISGNDAAGVVSINIGAGATSGTLATVFFHNSYGNIPRVVISPVGVGGSFYLPSVGTGGFSIAVTSGLPPGGYRIDYIVFQ